MRINSDQAIQAAAESGRSSTSRTSAAQTSSSSLGADQAQLSGIHGQAAVLTAQLLQLPEVRQERVQALRQAVQSGNYAPDSKDVANAMIEDWSLSPAA